MTVQAIGTAQPSERRIILHTRGQVIEAHRQYGVHKRAAGVLSIAVEPIAEEVPIALAYNGISHAVMLATPQELEDFAVGFSLSECIVERAGEIYDINLVEHPNGMEVQVEIASVRALSLKERRRALAGRTGCGLCGAESLDQLHSHARIVESSAALSYAALARAQSQLLDMQPLYRLTGAVHAAAWCGLDGSVAIMREDVGRHNALDKLAGHLARARIDAATGLLLLTSRVSVEMVQKAAFMAAPVMVAISAPTALALREADAAGITIVAVARDDGFEVFTHPARIETGR